MTEPANVTTESGTAADGDRDEIGSTTADSTAVITENGDDGAGDADLVPNH